MSSTVRSLRLVAWPALLLALGCASTPTPSPTEPAAATKSTPPITNQKDPGEVTIRGASSADLTPVYFDTDRALLRPDAREALKHYAKAILDHPEWGVLTIDGHCDERGSEEYNLALGGRRAAVVERYLLDLGVPPSRLNPRTFGEDKPAVAAHDEEAWRYNRRSELRPEKVSSARR